MGDQDFPLERSWYIGNAFFAILYGLQMSMFFQSVYHLNIGEGTRRSKIFYIGYVLGGIDGFNHNCPRVQPLLWFVSDLILSLSPNPRGKNQGQAMWIEHRDVDGGPVAFFGENIAAWYNTLGTAADVTANFLGDGLMLYRCHVFWGHSRVAMALPVLLYLGSVAMGITTTIQSGLPGGDLFEGITVNFGIPWIVLTIVFNILVTAMIAVRLFSVHSKVNRVVGKAVRKRYTGLLAILVESAAPFTILGVVYLALYIKELPESLAFADIWGCFVSLSPQAIILRVAMGGAWTKDTFNQLESGMELGPVGNPNNDHEEESGKISHTSSRV
ncbi:hypothetical protein C8F04DRAFT_1254813 [Mycena alexandri]|uniref:Uncharacterized protein n=1 Tax=Mycena alexandri TaxID=1745969 RepID=A0AAD6X7I0_9AGAR|nr:hypothetical protein C8F04DRAFT_1254813 [Mycena alexandri]